MKTKKRKAKQTEAAYWITRLSGPYDDPEQTDRDFEAAVEDGFYDEFEDSEYYLFSDGSAMACTPGYGWIELDKDGYEACKAEHENDAEPDPNDPADVKRIFASLLWPKARAKAAK